VELASERFVEVIEAVSEVVRMLVDPVELEVSAVLVVAVEI